MKAKNGKPLVFQQAMMEELNKIFPPPGVIFKQRNGYMMGTPKLRSRIGLRKALGPGGVWIHFPKGGKEPLLVHVTERTDLQMAEMFIALAHNIVQHVIQNGRR